MSKSYFPSDSGHPEFTQHQTSERAWMDLPIGHCSDPAYDKIKFPFHTIASFILYKKNMYLFLIGWDLISCHPSVQAAVWLPGDCPAAAPCAA